jgi:single-stranded-DNA-specific exonuclease
MSDISYKSLKYKWVYKDAECDDIHQLASELGMPLCITEVLHKRDLYRKDTLESFFKTPLKGISSPFLMKDMEKAADLIAETIKNKERICIYGDYDVDGVTSYVSLFERGGCGCLLLHTKQAGRGLWTEYCCDRGYCIFRQ